MAFSFLLQQELQFTMINVIEYVRTLKQYETLDVDELNKNMAELAIVIEKNTEEVNAIELNYPKLEAMAKETKTINMVSTVFQFQFRVDFWF